MLPGMEKVFSLIPFFSTFESNGQQRRSIFRARMKGSGKIRKEVHGIHHR
jgi:hypothetical protein